jgi:hypothetical protein
MSLAELHDALDRIMAMYILAHPGPDGFPSRVSILEVARWLNEQRVAEEEALRRAH